MLDLKTAQDRLIAIAPRLESEACPVEEALGRCLAKSCNARRDHPDRDVSAMDGFALCGEGEVWTLIGESRAGAPFDRRLEPGQCIRISTGAQLPQGGEAILLLENAVLDGKRVRRLDDPPQGGRHIRRRGFDFVKDEAVIEAGTRLGPAQIALALAAGHSQLECAPRPRIAIIDSGDELARDPQRCAVGKIPASNGAMLAAMVAPFASDCHRIGPVADELSALGAALREAEHADVIVTSGGASIGPHDLIRPALEDWGASIDFWKVAIKPGKPLIVARKGQTIVLGLPGNPVSSFVTAALFLLPLLRRMMGARCPLPRPITARAGCDIPAGSTRGEFLRAVYDGEFAKPLDSQDSAGLKALSHANCLIERSAHCPSARHGDRIAIYHFPDLLG